MNYSITRENELYHHGVKGMHWGVRRYQNADGSLTAEGQKRYGITGHVSSNGKYVASNGVVIGKSRNKSIDVMRRVSITPVGRAMSAAGRGQMSRLTGRSKESIKQQENREREALKEYYKLGGDKILKKQDSVKKYKEASKKMNKTDSEMRKLFKADKRLYKDFGSPSQVDDSDYVAMVAEEYGINTNAYWNAKTDYNKFVKENSQAINEGRKLVKKYS